MTIQDDDTQVQEAEGITARRTTLVTTGLGGTAGTLIGLATHGPAGLFFGVVGTAAALALEYHGTPEEYATLARHLGEAQRWMARRRRQQQQEVPPLLPTAALTMGAYTDDTEPMPLPAAPEPPRSQLVLTRHASQEGGTLRLSASSSSSSGAQAAFFALSDVLWRGFVPSLSRLYLATLEDGTDVVVPANRLCHVAIAGATRGGKGHIKRLLMAQLCYAGAEVYLLDPHYTRWDRESRDPLDRPCPEDWTPYTPYLQNDPADLIPVRQKYQVIGEYLHAALGELDRRLERYGHSLPVGRPLYLFLDELPAIVDAVPQAQAILKKLLREGAKVGVNVVCLSQDFLVKTLFPNDGGGAIRDCYRTVLYVGGDATTARILLDMPARDVPEHELGKGRVMLRCDSVRPAARARAPYVDNQALYALLGPSTYSEQDDEEDEVWSVDVTVGGPQLRPARGAAPAPVAALRVAEVHLDPPSGATPPVVPPHRYHGHGTGREAHRARMRERERRLRSRSSREPGEPQAAPARPEDVLTVDERKVLEAYRNGAKTGMAIKSVTGVAGTRVNECLHKLGPVLGLIDWQPRQK